MHNYKYQMGCKETAQPIRDESYPQLPSKPVRVEGDYITKIRAAMPSKGSAVTPHAVKGTKQNHVTSLDEWNKRAWVTQEIFLDWYANYFCPCAPFLATAKSHLHLDKSSGHPAILSAVRTPLHVSVVYMPSNTTSIFQPMDQEVIATFKAYYLCQTFMEMVRVLDRSLKSIRALI